MGGPFGGEMPMNPNGMNKRGAPPNNAGMPQNAAQGQGKNSHFDPITSLTQMSNLLTNNVAGSMNGQAPPGGYLQGNRNNNFMNSPHGMHGMGNEMTQQQPAQQQQPHHMQQQQPPHLMQQQQDCAMPGMPVSPMECGGMGGMNPNQFPGPMHNQMIPGGMRVYFC